MQTRVSTILLRIIIILFFVINLHADVKEDMFNLYQNKKYEDACKIGFKNFKHYRSNEDFVSLYAFSCLHSDYLDRLSIPIATLKFSPEARANSAYLSVILMQKKLLYHALIDGYDLSSLKLPTTDYALSKVFDLYTELGKHEKKDVYIFNDKDDEKLKYKLYILDDERLSKMVIEVFYNSISIKRHIYW